MDFSKIESLIGDVMSMVGSQKGGENNVKYNEKMEALIDAVLDDGKITEEEKSMLFKKAVEMGINPDDLTKVVTARLEKQQQKGILDNVPIQEIAGKLLSFLNKK